MNKALIQDLSTVSSQMSTRVRATHRFVGPKSVPSNGRNQTRRRDIHRLHTFLQLLQPSLLLLQHRRLYPQPIRHDAPPRGRDLERKPIGPERPQRLPLHQAVVVRVPPVELERLPERDGRVRDHARDAQVVLRCRMQHERVEQHDVADVARELDERAARPDRLEVRPVAGVVRGVGVRGVRRREGERRRADALGVRGKVAGDLVEPVGADVRAAPARLDRGENGNHQQSLLGRVEEMHLRDSA